ncbi:MAG: hypothetical protein EAX96_18150 [Candidatus Lokiarchaeota archaeon]|nr:hypothetical protein [Candidatus Lokiarchaeota archaeon]
MNEGLQVKIKIETPFNNTESFIKIEKAIKTLFFNVNCQVEGEGVKRKVFAELEGIKELSILYNSFRNQMILDVARRMMFKELLGDTFTIYFNKQAAFVGKIHFSLVEEENKMLGPIKVLIQANYIEKLINYLAPETIDGKIIE